MAGDTGEACLSILRETDRDRYLACLLSPPEKRGALAALYAFNAEIARVRERVREPLPGEIRLQWWRDLIGQGMDGGSVGEAAGNPVAAGLSEAIARHALPRHSLTTMIDARVFDLYDDAMPTRHDFEGYAGETASALIQLAGLVLSAPDAARSAEMAGHSGVAQTVAGALLLLPLHRRRQQLYLPLDILAATGLDRDSFLSGENTAAVSAAIEAFSSFGLDHLAKARAAGPAQPAIFAAFLPVALVESVLRRARRSGAALFDQPIQMAQWRRQLSLLRAAMRRRF